MCQKIKEILAAVIIEKFAVYVVDSSDAVLTRGFAVRQELKCALCEAIFPSVI
jgi:hypothetical protein